MRGYRHGQNPIGKALKGVGKAIGDGMEAIAEADRIARQREAEQRQLEAGYRSSVEDAIREYEKNVGRPFQMHPHLDPTPSAGFNSGLPWDFERKGHLVTCRDNCVTDHCLTCGMESYGQVYCSRHRP